MENLKTCAQYGIFDCGCCVNTGNNTNCKNYKPIASNTEYDELIYSPRLLAKNYVKECKVGNKIINKFGDLKENTTREYCANLRNILNSPSTSNTLISNAIHSEHKPENLFNNNSTSNQIMEFTLSSDNKELNKFLEFEDRFWKDINYESQFLNENNALQETTKEEKLSMSICPVNSKYDDKNVLHQTRNKFEYTSVEKVFDSERDENIIHQDRNKLEDTTVAKVFTSECDENLLHQARSKFEITPVENLFDCKRDENIIHQARNKLEDTTVEKVFNSERDENIIHQARNKLEDITVEKVFSSECDENVLRQARSKFEITPVENIFDSKRDENIIHQARNKLEDTTVEKVFSSECDENVLHQIRSKFEITPVENIFDSKRDENIIHQARNKLEDTTVEKVFDSERKNTPKIENSKNEMQKTSNLTNSSGTSDEIDILNIPDLANFVLKNVALDKVVDSGSEDLSKLYEPAQKTSNLFNSSTTSEEINFINIPEFEEFLARNLPFAVQDNNYSDGCIEINNEMNITSIAPKIEEFRNQPVQEIWNLIDLPSTSKQMTNMPDILENLIGKNMSTGGVSNIDQKIHKMLSNPNVNNLAHNNKKRLSKIEERRNKRRKKTQNFEPENEAVIFVGAYSNTARSAEHNVVIEISDSPTRVPVIDEIICLSDNENEKDERDSRLGECPVCLENFSTKDIMSTICGHIFCAECIKSVIKTTKKCPKCRKRLSLKKIHPLFI